MTCPYFASFDSKSAGTTKPDPWDLIALIQDRPLFNLFELD